MEMDEMGMNAKSTTRKYKRCNYNCQDDMVGA